MIGIVGAGLAGLICARTLQKAGAEFVLLEAAAGPGGRVKSHHNNGFTIDHGFQIFLDSYGQLRRHIDPADLDPRCFDSGAILWDQGKFLEVRSPLRHPGAAFTDLTTRAFSFLDKIKLAGLVTNLLTTSDDELLDPCRNGLDETTEGYLIRSGFSEESLRRFFRPFFGGVFLDETLSTSKGLFWFYLKKFASGRAFLPAAGAGALPRLLASAIPSERIRYNSPVGNLETKGNRVTAIRLVSGELIPVSQVVLATDDPSTRRILGQMAPRPSHSVKTLYFHSDEPLYNGKLLLLPAGAGRAIHHLTSLTNIAPEYSADGKALLSVTVLREGRETQDEWVRVCLDELEEIFPGSRKRLSFLEMNFIPYAVPRQPPGFAAELAATPGFANLKLAGDQITAASVETTMRSGEEAAQLCLSNL